MVYRHGDVNLVEVSATDYEAAKRRGMRLPAASSHILAKGEATGSVHLLEVSRPDQMELVQDGDTLWLKLTAFILRTALRKYGRHDGSCQTLYGGTCTCGLTAALGQVND